MTLNDEAKAIQNAKNANQRILTIDIERLPGMVPIFDQRTQGFIPVYKWTRLPSLLCFAAKWLDRKDIMFYSAWDDMDEMVQKSWDLFNEADIVVTYNGIRFDVKHLRSEWWLTHQGPPRPWKNVDLFAVNKAQFGFESKSLQHLCDRLGIAGKSGHYDPAVAERCVNGDPKAQALMKRYNKGDVTITENVYRRMLPWIHNHPHVLTASSDFACNKCGSTDLEKMARDYRAQVLEYEQYRCNNCKGIVAATHTRRVARTRGVQ
jgi:predicted RNA-binding Zn-ribbon protein involved in translation (DUF1610 family)